jgi:hypothetical protein
MHFEQLQVAVVERPRAATADPGKKLQRLRPVALLAFFGIAPCFQHDTIETFIGLRHITLIRLV